MVLPLSTRCIRYLILFCSIYIAGYYNTLSRFPLPSWLPSPFPCQTAKLPICRPPLPAFKTLGQVHPNPRDPHIQQAATKLDAWLKNFVSNIYVDSVSVAVVTPDGPVFSKGYGVRRANETGSGRGKVDENTIYRIASVSKLFTALELWILKERGCVKWDDDIIKYLPSFRYYPGSWADRLKSRSAHEHFTSNSNCPSRKYEPITLRQVASHTAGIPRDFPPAVLSNFPKSMDGAGLPHYNHRRAPTQREILEALRTYPLSNDPGSPPLYSNTGYALLGMAAVAAHRSCGGIGRSYGELVKRDIFDPLGLNGSMFSVRSDVKDKVAVSSYESWEIDADVGTMNPAYGQLSSVADLAKVMQIVLNPERPDSVISPYSLREWLRPTHAWMDDMTEVGLLWEIIKVTDLRGRRQRIFQKLGEFMGHFSGFAFNPTSSFGVVVLMTGEYSDSEKVILEAFNNFLPAFDLLHETATTNMFAGTWKAVDSLQNNSAVISIRDGSMWLDEFVLQGQNVLGILRDDDPEKVALVSTGRVGEFRLAKGYRPYTGKEHYGCMPFWVINDPGYTPRGAPVDIIYFVEDGNGKRTLEVPSLGISLKRASHSCQVD